MASDFAVPRFRFLQRLLIVHGHWCYTRLASMALYFFYKNTVRGAGASKVLRLGGRACADRQVQRSPSASGRGAVCARDAAGGRPSSVRLSGCPSCALGPLWSQARG